MLSPFKKLKDFINGVDEDELEAEEEYRNARESEKFKDYSDDNGNPFKPEGTGRTIPVDFKREVEERTGTKIETPISDSYTRGSKMNIVIVEPKEYKDSAELVEKLKNNEPILVNLELLDTETSKRIFDFLCGATIALDGSIKKVSSHIILFSPSDVRVTSFEKQIVSE